MGYNELWHSTPNVILKNCKCSRLFHWFDIITQTIVNDLFVNITDGGNWFCSLLILTYICYKINCRRVCSNCTYVCDSGTISYILFFYQIQYNSFANGVSNHVIAQKVHTEINRKDNCQAGTTTMFFDTMKSIRYKKE